MELRAWQFLIIINIFFLIPGAFLKVFAAMLITLPVILPLLGPLGIGPIRFAVLMTFNMELALLIPPIGLNIFVLSSITKTPVGATVKGVLPFMLLLGLLIAVTCIPAISPWLPNLVCGQQEELEASTEDFLKKARTRASGPPGRRSATGWSA